MADGRMLKKAINTSRKLAALKTDTARLLYTWILPHLDIEGRFFADPDVIKGFVVPRLKHITPEIIADCLKDMENNELIVVYPANCDYFLEFSKFADHQTLRKDREKASELPPPPGVLPESSRSTPPQVKLREVKLSKSKGSEEEKTLLAAIQEKADEIYKKELFVSPKNGPKEVYQFVGKSFKKKLHLKTIIHCLNQIIKHDPQARGIECYAYIQSILKVENGNYHEQDGIMKHEIQKKLERESN